MDIPNLNLAGTSTSSASSSAKGGVTLVGGATSGSTKFGLVKILAIFAGISILLKIYKKVK